MNSRDKGARGERELAKILREHGFECRRGQQFCGANGDADVVGIKGIHIEAKRVERLNITDAMSQAIHDCGDKLPVVMHRKNNEDWMVTMRLEDWLSLYNEWEVHE